MLKEPDPKGRPKTAEAWGGRTWADAYSVYVNWRTASALEQLGFVEIDRTWGGDDGWEILLIEHPLVFDGDAP
jgi:hypothetical protein